MQMKGLKQELAERVVAERSANGGFRSFQEFLVRVRPEPAQVRCLVKAGCCDSIAGEVTRPGLALEGTCPTPGTFVSNRNHAARHAGSPHTVRLYAGKEDPT